jgi:hypothetical protein
MVISLQKGRLIGLAAVPRNRSTISDTGGSGKGHGAHVSIKHPKVQDRGAIQLVLAASSACLYSRAVLRWPLPHCCYSCVNPRRAGCLASISYAPRGACLRMCCKTSVVVVGQGDPALGAANTSEWTDRSWLRAYYSGILLPQSKVGVTPGKERRASGYAPRNGQVVQRREGLRLHHPR